MDFHVTSIENGVRVVTVPMPGVESVSAGIWAGVGSRFEDEQNSGASHFLEHMLFKGTKKRSARDIVCAVEGRGGYMNAFTQEESTCYYFRAASDGFRSSYDVLADMVASSSFPADEVVREKGVIVEEIMMYRDQPSQVAQDMMTEAMWSRHPVGMTITGTPESVGSISRRDLMSFYRTHYVPSAIVASFAGKVVHDECVDLVRKHLGRMRPGPLQKAKPVRIATGQKMMALRNSSIEQAHLSLGFRIFGRKDPRRFALRVLNAVLGENMSSRLFYSVREKHGLAYSIHSSSHLMQDTGGLVISGGFDKKRLGKAVEVTVRELVKLKMKPVGKGELRRSKDYIIGQIKLGMESSSSRMMWGGEQLISAGKILSPDEVIDRIGRITADEVMSLAKEIFDSSRLSLGGVSSDIESKAGDLERALMCL